MSDLLKINVNDDLEYEPETGKFYWRRKKGCRAAGAEAGSIHSGGYVSIFNGGKRHFGHRLAVLAMTGNLPESVVDHINGNRSDNRWSNLRAVSQSDNMANRRGLPQSNSKTGVLGVSPHAFGGFVAQIRRNKRHQYLGYFATVEAAQAAYLEASK